MSTAEECENIVAEIIRPLDFDNRVVEQMLAARIRFVFEEAQHHGIGSVGKIDSAYRPLSPRSQLV
jgi:hypothetical protein